MRGIRIIIALLLLVFLGGCAVSPPNSGADPTPEDEPKSTYSSMIVADETVVLPPARTEVVDYYASIVNKSNELDMDKSPYESDAEYQQRVTNFATVMETDIPKPVFDIDPSSIVSYGFVYDPTSEILSFTVRDNYVEDFEYYLNFHGWEIEGASGSKILGSYVGQNAYGAMAEVTKVNSYVIGIIDVHGEEYHRKTIKWELPMSRDVVRTLTKMDQYRKLQFDADRVGIRVSGKLASPFSYGRSIQLTPRLTDEKPTEGTYTEAYIAVEIEKIFIYEKGTDKVLYVTP